MAQGCVILHEEMVAFENWQIDRQTERHVAAAMTEPPALANLIAEGGELERLLRPALAASDQVALIDELDAIGQHPSVWSLLAKVATKEQGRGTSSPLKCPEAQETLKLGMAYNHLAFVYAAESWSFQAPAETTFDLPEIPTGVPPVLRSLLRQQRRGTAAMLVASYAAHCAEPLRRDQEVILAGAFRDAGYAALRLVSMGGKVPTELLPAKDQLDANEVRERSKRFNTWLDELANRPGPDGSATFQP